MVEFNDGEKLDYKANMIAENIYAQSNAEGSKCMMSDSIIDHGKVM
jgi:hypothetical protein